MLSKSQIGFIKSLHQKKYRKEHGIFIIEGIKSILEFIPSAFQIHTICYLPQYQSLLPKLPSNIKLFEVNNAELEKISTLQAPQGVLALVHIPKESNYSIADLKGKYNLVLDGIQDPGNLGTIIRTADWFGFTQVICSENTVDVYNPKTAQATMGSLARVKIWYTDLEILLKETDVPVYGAMLDGKNLYAVNWSPEGIVLLGNEGQGVSDAIGALINESITIPKVGAGESLNVAISAAIICSEISRILQK
ncbi:TrmH family RNA methyltransferase [Pedobacter duraquae]|uniref:TrmH family RNA methyltransferase n=1 Tax=Pedobacter duraquae TaxID=425511 RepID=A0A4R6IRN6_9SPHI|nr:RNA methyltransferase [Pedobacter duraquae]TDO24871.1 TrmH family RNA methyltransferase [Pedobacter duraquae]